MGISTNAVKAVIKNKEDKVLLLRSNPETRKKVFWDFPGGLIDLGENGEEALIREVKEELGVNASIIKKSNTWKFFRDSLDQQWVSVQNYICTLDDYDFELSDEHSEYAWVKIEDIAKYDIKDESFLKALKDEKELNL